MPGFLYCHQKEEIPEEQLGSLETKLIHKGYLAIEYIFKSPNEILLTNLHHGYPAIKWNYLEYEILLLGLIYNYDKSELKGKLNKIADNNFDINDIKFFVANADGNFVVLVNDKKRRQLIVFNDLTGRQPLYYYSSKYHTIICSELKGILHFIPRIEPSKFGILDSVMFTYTLGNRTMFNNISRLNPGELIHFKKGDDFSIKKTEQLDYETRDRFSSKDKAIYYLKEAFYESLENRTTCLEKAGFKLISDLSGGFDTRIICGGLSQLNKKVDYYTFEYYLDESYVAKEVFEKAGSIGTYNKLKFKNELNWDDIPDLLYIVDCLTDYFTTSICFNDVEYMYKVINNKKIARFGGLGGEFFRHPYKRKYKSLIYGITNGFYNEILNPISELLNVDKVEYLKNISDYFDLYPEKKLEEKLKRLYHFEYYRKNVMLSGEDRERIHFWGVQPLYSNKLIKAFANKFPLKWANYNFFSLLIKSIDKNLLDVPIYNRNIKLSSSLSRKLYDIKNNFRTKNIHELAHFTKDSLPFIYDVFRGVNHLLLTKKKEVFANKWQNSLKYYNKLKYTKHIFNKKGMNNYFEKYGTENRKITSLMIYFNKLEEYYSSKF